MNVDFIQSENGRSLLDLPLAKHDIFNVKVWKSPAIILLSQG